MKPFTLSKLVSIAFFSLLLVGASARAAEADLKLEAQLVLCSNDAKSKGAPVTPEIEKKLQRLPLKWQYYFIVSTQKFSIAKDESKQVVLGKSEITLKNLGGQRVEATIVGHGKVTQSLRKGQTLVTNSNDDACLIVVQQTD